MFVRLSFLDPNPPKTGGGVFGQSLINYKNAMTKTKIVTKSGIKSVSSII